MVPLPGEELYMKVIIGILAAQFALVTLGPIVFIHAIIYSLIPESEKRRIRASHRKQLVSDIKKLLPWLAKAGVAVGVGITLPKLITSYSGARAFQKRKIVRRFHYFIEQPNENYISRLPDDVLCHIISYFDNKDEVRASVLSRRWRRMYYTLLPNPKFECHKMIDFATLTEHNKDTQRFVTRLLGGMFELVSLMIRGNCHCNDKQRFVTAVDTFLRLRTGIPMESFTLRFGLRREFSGHLRKWLDCIVRSGVRNLDINFCCEYELRRIPFSQLIEFPFLVLSSASTLEHVQLSSCILELNFEGPFNSLKELKLRKVPLVNWEVEIILSCCPQLKSLKLYSCKLSSKLLVIATELRTLDIRCCEQIYQVGLSTPNLDYLCYHNNCGLSFFPSSVPNLRSLYLNLSSQKRPAQGVGGFLSVAPSLRKLWIQANRRQVQDIQKEMPKLPNLEALSLHVIRGSLALRDIVPLIGSFHLRDIVSLIAVCPNISTFEFSFPDCSLSYTEVPLWCVNLKAVWLDGYAYDAAQIRFATKLIRCSPTLQNACRYAGSDRGTLLIGEALTLPRPQFP